jgi:hypothetical protein
MIDDAPIFEIEGEAELGRIDTSYYIGDVISNVVGSELADGTGGYYGIDCVLDKLEYTAINDKSDSYTSKMNFRNNLPLVLKTRTTDVDKTPKD